MRVLVVGDVIVDGYTHATPLGLSAETPTVVAELRKEERFVGGAGLVVRHLLRLGCDVVLHTVGEPGVSLDELLRFSSDAPTIEEMHRLSYSPHWGDTWRFTRKTRHFVNDYKLLQHDVINRGKYDDGLKMSFLALADEHLRSADALVICDNRHGVLSYGVGPDLIGMAYQHEVPSFVDSQVSQHDSNLGIYTGADFVLVNERELRAFNRFGNETDLLTNVREAERKLTVDRGPFYDGRTTRVILKLGKDGAAQLADGKLTVYPAPDVRAVDTCGAGDAFMAAYVASKCDIMEANRWAALSTLQKGTIVPRR